VRAWRGPVPISREPEHVIASPSLPDARARIPTRGVAHTGHDGAHGEGMTPSPHRFTAAAHQACPHADGTSFLWAVARKGVAGGE
jgi:hypothetical protein